MRCVVCAGIEPTETYSARTTGWISRQRAFGCKVGGICTGAFALARAGVLEGRKFTLHWENQPAFSETFLGLEPTGNLYENDRGLITCGGGSAATDMMLDIIERDHGRDLATIVADMCIHSRTDRQTAPQRSAYSYALGSRNPSLIRAMDFMNTQIETPADMADVAMQAGVSRRQLERLFSRHVGVTPAQFYIELRVSRAHALLSETAMSVGEVAAATGFASSSQLSQRFRKRYGMTPGVLRKGRTR